jgi:hypothetical protein
LIDELRFAFDRLLQGSSTMRHGLKAAIIADVFCPAPGEHARTAKGGIGDYLSGSLFQDNSPVEEALL